ncbi:MAG: hypothetical protein ABIC19_02420 [Patescibacteria group bacterium]|nr:hypothetical protein [Patescibacteria group bacterium]
MKNQPLLSSVDERLSKNRQKYINAQIEFEKGLTGFFRKLSFKAAKKPKQDQSLVWARDSYYGVLSQYRRILIEEFKKNNRQVREKDIQFIIRLTIFDEIQTLKKQKEKILRSRGLSGLIRAQLQEWRQISPGFKIFFGFSFLGLGFAASRISFIDFKWLEIPIFAWGIMILMEGFQQKITQGKATRKGMNRLALLESARRRLPEKAANLCSNLNLLHQYMEENIWNLRVFEKRIEYRRYLIAALAGIFTAALFFIPYGVKIALVSIVSSVFSRFIWFLLPYGAIRNGIVGIFKSNDDKPAETPELDILNDGEGLTQPHAIAGYSETQSPIFVKTQKQFLIKNENQSSDPAPLEL